MADKDRSIEEVVDEGVKESFPASDPVAATQPRKGKPAPAIQPAQPQKRSPDWMFEKK
jgi:hypothetical protein